MVFSKQNEVVESIKKLITLGVSDSEIIQNLKEVGLSEEDSKRLIDIARGDSSVLNEKKVIVDDSKGLDFKEQIASQAKIVKDDSDNLKKEENEDIEKLEPNEIDFGKEEEKEKMEEKVETEKVEKNNIGIRENNKDLNNKDENLSSSENNLVQSSKTNESDSKKEKSLKDELDFDKTIKSKLNELNNKTKASIDFKKELRDELAKLDNQRKANEFNESTKSELVKEVFPKSSLQNTNSQDTKVVSEEKLKSINSLDLEQMWKKGIVIAINTKLNEMKKLKEEIEGLMDEKVSNALKKETKQFRVLLESQKDLIVSSNKEVLEQKQKEISFIIDSKINDIKKQAKELSDYVGIMEQSKEDQQKLLEEIKKTLDDSKKLKSQLIVEMNSELIKSKSKAQEFIDKAEFQIKEMDDRINKSLELEKNIAEGLVEEAEQKIEKMTLQKADDLIDKLEIKLNNLSSLEKNINIEEIQTKISLLDQFKKEFLNSMEENINKLNEAIEQVNIKNSDVQKELDEKKLVIDAKLEELTKFEKTFTDKLEKLLDSKDDKK